MNKVEISKYRIKMTLSIINMLSTPPPPPRRLIETQRLLFWDYPYPPRLIVTRRLNGPLR